MTQNPFSILSFGSAEGGRPDQPRIEGVSSELLPQIVAEVFAMNTEAIELLRQGEHNSVEKPAASEDYYGLKAA